MEKIKKFKKVGLMKKFLFIILIITTYFFDYQIYASSLDGTSGIIYKAIPHVFHNGEFCKGFVALKNGFTVTPNSGARLKMESPVSLGMDLRTTGSIILENNLRLDSGFTLSSSGTICGNGYSLILDGNLIIPEMSSIKITSSLTIEGNGHTILFDSFAQLLTDSHSTLTLRNLILKNVTNSSGKSPIAANGTNSKITLDNVQFALNDNFYFNMGSLFFHNDVLFSGENQFIYRSKQPSYITPKSTLCFDIGSTLFYSPGNSNQNLIIPQDKSSNLLFNGATLRITPTGMNVSNGKILFENQSNIDAGTKITNPSFTIQNINHALNIRSVDWNFAGKFLATGGWANHTDHLKIYSFDAASSNLNLVNGLEFGSYTCTVYAVSWSPDGEFLAIGGSGAKNGSGGFNNHDNLRIYQFDTASFTLTPFTSVDFGITSTIYSIDWGGADDYYIAIGGSGALAVGNFNNTHNLRIYHFNKNNITLEPITSYDCGDLVKTAKWNFSGEYLAVGGKESNTICNLNLFYFDPNKYNISDKIQLKDTQVFRSPPSDATMITCVDWSSDSKYLALGGIEGSKPSEVFGEVNILIYEFNPVSETFSLLTFASDESVLISYIKWNQNNNYLAYGGEEPAYGGDITSFLYFNPNTDFILNYLGNGTLYSMSGAWNPLYTNIFASGGKPGFRSWFTHYGSNLKISSFNQGSFTIADNKPLTTTYNTYDGAYSVDWRNDGNYIATGGQGASTCGGFNNTDEIRIYRFNNTSEKLSAITSQKYGTRVYVTNWSPDGKYLAVGGKGAINGGGFSNTNQVRIYEFKNDNLYPITSVSLGAGATLFSMKWHPSGKYLALGSYNAGTVGAFPSGNNLRIYSFDGVTLTEVTSLNPTYAVMGVDWSHDGKYLAIGTFNCPSDYPDNPYSHSVYNPGKLRIYEFQNYSALTQKAIYPSASSNMGFFGVSWGPDNQYIAANYTAIGGSGYSGSRTASFAFNGTDLTQFRDFDYSSSDVAGISEVKISPDGQNVASVYLRGLWTWKYFGSLLLANFIETLNTSKVPVQRFLPFIGNFQAWSVSWSPNSKYLAIAYFNTENSDVPQIAIYKISNKTNIMNPNNSGLDFGRYVDVNVLSGALVNVNGIVNYAK